MMDAVAHCVRTGTVEEAEPRCGARLWKTLVVAEEALQFPVPQMKAGDRGGDSACAGEAQQRPSR